MLWNVAIFSFFMLHGVVIGKVREAKRKPTAEKTELSIKPGEYWNLINGWTLSYFDINSLKGDNWLTGGIIDYAVEVIIGRGNSPLTRSTNFVSKTSVIYIKADRATAFLNGLESFNERTRDLHISYKNKIILFPFCYNNNHWCLIIIDTSKETIRYYDPRDPSNQSTHLNSTAMNYMHTVRLVFNNRNKHVKKSEQLNSLNWRFDSNQYVQLEAVTNSHDCGLYIIRYIDVFLNARDTKINKTDVRESIRKFILGRKC